MNYHLSCKKLSNSFFLNNVHLLIKNMEANSPTEGEKTVSITGTEIALFKLTLSGKDITELPKDDDDSTSYSEIRSLDVSNNQFSTLDFVDQCPNLVELDISENQISGGLDHLSKLRFLAYINLSANILESLTDFPNLDTLVSLDLSKNHLTTISELPSMPLLENLNLSHNSISELNLASQPSLRTLNLCGNLVTSLNLPQLPSLRILDASHNSIQEIQPFDEDYLPFVWFCDLRNNSLSSPDTLKSLSKLPLLYNLMINNNPLAQDDNSHIAPILVILPGLTELDEKHINAKDKVKADLTVNKNKEADAEDKDKESDAEDKEKEADAEDKHVQFEEQTS